MAGGNQADQMVNQSEITNDDGTIFHLKTSPSSTLASRVLLHHSFRDFRFLNKAE